jgi:hypothetical protein
MGRMRRLGLRADHEIEGDVAPTGAAAIDDGPVDRDRRRFLQAAAAATALAYAAPAVTGLGAPRAYAAVSPPPDQVRHDKAPKAETTEVRQVAHGAGAVDETAVEGVALDHAEQLPRTGADTTRLAVAGAGAAVAGAAVLRNQSAKRGVTETETEGPDEGALD